MPEKTEVEALVLESVRLLAEDFEIEALRKADAQSRLYGEDGHLDSMALVNLIADLEEAVAEKYGASIALADEKAMSASRSPYRSVGSMTEAVMERIGG